MEDVWKQMLGGVQLLTGCADGHLRLLWNELYKVLDLQDCVNEFILFQMFCIKRSLHRNSTDDTEQWCRLQTSPEIIIS